MESNEVLRLVLTQVWQVGLLAAVVWILTKKFTQNQPQMAHLLWGLVLIKVITPPVWSSPISVFSWLGCGAYSQQNAEPEMVNAGPRSNPTASTLNIHLSKATETSRLDSLPTLSSRTDDASSARESLAMPAADEPTWVGESLLKVWILGVCFLIMVNVIRLASFWCWVRASMRRSKSFRQERCRLLEARMQATTHATAAKLGIRCKIRVRLIDAPIGPAVVGLFRPTIILPLGIVENRSTEFLEPLIAHELLHIRRGDLFWAVLQTLSTSLLWFHPLVWLAARKLTLESERSCDEQTIAWLGCSPKAYARSLIDVLERKHQLRVAPALPGVRPVDVTRKRLERIMRLGQGSRKKSPIWAWAIFVGAVALVLPGAAFVGAQDQDAADTPRPRTEPTQTPSVSHAPEPTPTQIDRTHFEVGDLLENLKASGKSEEQASDALLSLLPQGVLEQIYWIDSDGSVRKSRNAHVDGTILHVTGTRKLIANVKQALEERRQLGFDQVQLTVCFITISKDRMEQLDIPWRKAAELPDDQFNKAHFDDESLSTAQLRAAIKMPHPPAAPREDVFYSADGSKVTQTSPPPQGQYLYQPGVPDASVPPDLKNTISFDEPKLSELQMPAIPTPAFYAIVADNACREILDNVQSDKRANVLQGPRVTAFNGALIHISDTVQRPFVTGILPIQGKASITIQPIIQVAVEGIKVLTQPIVDASGNIELLLAVNERRIQQVETFSYDKAVLSDSEGNRVETGKTVQIPQLLSRFLALKTNLKSGESLFVTSGISTLEASTSGADEVLIAVATTSDIRDVAQQEKPVSNAVVPASANTQNQPTRSAYSVADIQKSEPELDHEQLVHERYERISVVGPITADGPPTALDPPSDDEILQAMQKFWQTRGDNPEIATIQRTNVLIAREKIADYVDPARFIPLVGKAQLHHAHYKCSVYFTERSTNGRPSPHNTEVVKEAVEVVYIDHNHYHLVGNPKTE